MVITREVGMKKVQGMAARGAERAVEHEVYYL